MKLLVFKVLYNLLVTFLVFFYPNLVALNSTNNIKRNIITTLPPEPIVGMAVIPAQAPISRLLISNTNNQNQNIRHETYKALLGETVRLECPQPNPTWFFRKRNSEDHKDSDVEDLIVTRHGIINADYKYKIMCHVTLKHQVIIINNIDFEEEGLYTCLYTLPSLNESPFISSFDINNKNVDDNNDDDDDAKNSRRMPMQYRYVFNVTVYTLISGLSMSLKPILMKPQSLLQEALIKRPLDKQQQNFQNDQYEIMESSLTVRENEEFFINCNVESSRPAADVTFTIGNSPIDISNVGNHNRQLSNVYLFSASAASSISSSSTSSLISPLSIVSSFTNTIKNEDHTFRTIQTNRLKAHQEDHGKVIACKAENGFSSQKWENKKLLNVLFAPVCKDPPNFVYYIGINQTLNVECRILNANPNHITYEWNLDNISHGIKSSSSSVLNNQQYLNNNNNNKYSNDNYDHDNENGVGLDVVYMPRNSDKNVFGASSSSLINFKKINNDDEQKHEKEQKDLTATTTASPSIDANSRFRWRPTSLRDFGIVKCKATNEIGSTECSYELKLGGVPNPPTDCTHVLKNTSAIISCQVGFHQGDPDIYCYLLKKTDTGAYKEHTRNRESCSFIVNDVNINKLNEFWIYSSNKHGHNKDVGVYLTIGEMQKLPEPLTSNKSFMVIVGVVGLAIFLFLACCFCIKLRKGLSDDAEDSVLDSDAYHLRGTNNANGFMSGKKMSQAPSGTFSNKIIKGVKIGNQEKPKSFDSSDSSKYGLNTKPSSLAPTIGNGAFTYTEPYSYTTMEKSDDASINESLAKKLESEFDYSYKDNKKSNDMNKKKKSKFSLFKKQETPHFTKELLETNRHAFNFSNNQASHYTSSLQRHHHNHNSKTRLDGLDKLKKSISFTKSHEDNSAIASSYSNSSGDAGNKEQLEPLVLNNYSSLVNSNGLLTTTISLNKNKNKKLSSLTSSSQSPSPSHTSPSSPSSSINSLNESPSNKMISFLNSKNYINNKSNGNINTNSFTRGGGQGGVQKPNGLANFNCKTDNNNNIGTIRVNNSITTLNMNNSANTTVTTTASSSSSTSSGTSSSSPTTSSANQDDIEINFHSSSKRTTPSTTNNLTVSDQSFNLMMISQQSRPLTVTPLNPPTQILRSKNMSTFSNNSSSTSFSHQRQNQNEQFLHFATPRHFINTSNSNENQQLPPPPPPTLPTSSSLLESSGSFSTNGCFSSSFAANDRISDSLDAKFLNKLCEEIEVSLNVDCECADDYSSNEFSGDYSFDHELIKQQKHEYSPMQPFKYTPNSTIQTNMTNTNHMKNYLNGNLRSTNGGVTILQKNLQQQSQRSKLQQESNGQNSQNNTNNNNSGKSHLGVLV